MKSNLQCGRKFAGAVLIFLALPALALSQGKRPPEAQTGTSSDYDRGASEPEDPAKNEGLIEVEGFTKRGDKTKTPAPPKEETAAQTQAVESAPSPEAETKAAPVEEIPLPPAEQPAEIQPEPEKAATELPPATVAVAESAGPASSVSSALAVHTVWVWQETKDCLWTLAKKYYGDPWKWKKIYLANRNTILDPTVIFPKQKIVIPPLEQ